MERDKCEHPGIEERQKLKRILKKQNGTEWTELI